VNLRLSQQCCPGPEEACERKGKEASMAEMGKWVRRIRDKIRAGLHRPLSSGEM
jgi:hypothetical protein